MRFKTLSLLSTAASLILFPSLVSAQSGQLSTEAPGVVELPRTLDAHKLSSGATFETKLINKVHLSNGSELPKGSKLIATVVDDDMQLNGKLKLALRFSVADKSGKAVPIKATMLAVSTDIEPVPNNTDALEAVMQVPENLNGQSDQIEETVSSGVTLHARADSANSGVLLTDKDDIKLPAGSKIELAIAPAQ